MKRTSQIILENEDLSVIESKTFDAIKEFNRQMELKEPIPATMNQVYNQCGIDDLKRY